MKYIFVTGGVLSGIGKGITAASCGSLLKECGQVISIQKCDPYLNVDAGTLNPAEHGECFVTADGAETDLDLGHYERFLDSKLSKQSTTLSGRLLRELIEEERGGKFLGKTIQLVPHLTNKIKQSILDASVGSDIHIVEIGGTVGDYESLPFIEAIRSFSQEVGRANCLFVHVVYVPYLQVSGEFKTKPAQNALHNLGGFGIFPEIVIARTEQHPSPEESDVIKNKLKLYGGIPKERIVVLPNAKTIYEVPITISQTGICNYILEYFNIGSVCEDPAHIWKELVTKISASQEGTLVKIGIVAKYLDNKDTYFSVHESLKIAGWHMGVNVVLDYISAEELEKTADYSILKAYDGILVPGGFGTRGVEGKIGSAGYCLEHNIPYLGICLGLQVAVIAAARRGGVPEATTEEIAPSSEGNVIYLMATQDGKIHTGGTMRLGEYTARLVSGTVTESLYGNNEVIERHRHRYEVNRTFEKNINKGGLIVSGESIDGRLVEFVESPHHRFFVATQAHPEFLSRPVRPHPLFEGFIRAVSQDV